MRFENLGDYPEFDFYLMYGYGSGNPAASPHLFPVRSGEPFRHPETNGRKGSAVLFAVPHGRQPPAVSREHDFFSEKMTPDCLRSSMLEGTSLGKVYLVPYRVRIDEGKLQVTMLSPEIQPVAMTLLWLELLLWIAVPVAFCVALGWLAVRIARRLLKGSPSPS
jgi:hypothetical protein